MQTTNGLTEGQKKLPAALQRAILKKKKGKKVEVQMKVLLTGGSGFIGKILNSTTSKA